MKLDRLRLYKPVRTRVLEPHEVRALRDTTLAVEQKHGMHMRGSANAFAHRAATP